MHIKIENWIKSNLVLSGVILAFILYFTYNEFLAKPDNYEDCVLEVVMNTKTNAATKLGNKACRDKFFENPFKNVPLGLSPNKPNISFDDLIPKKSD